MTSLAETLHSTRYPLADVEAALAEPATSWRVLAEVRDDDEARFRPAAVAWLRSQPDPANPRLEPLARDRVEGNVGSLEERPCDHLCRDDVVALLGALDEPTHDDLVDVFLVGELGDEEATGRLGARLAEVPRDRLPSSFYSHPRAIRHLYRALRARFSDPNDELAHLLGWTQARAVAVGGAVLAQAQGRPWPEVVPIHGRGGPNASRALTWAAATLGGAGLKRWLKDILDHPLAKHRVECAALDWEERFDGVGDGKAVRARRAGAAIVIEVGKGHPRVPVLPGRARRTVKVCADADKAAREFAKRVDALKGKHDLRPVPPADLEGLLERCGGEVPSDYAVALLEMGAPRCDLFWLRSDPEVTRRAILAGSDPAAETTPRGEPLLAALDTFPEHVQRAEILVEAGATLSAPDRLTRAAERGELAMARLLLRAGAPVEDAALEHARPWPRLERLLRDAKAG